MYSSHLGRLGFLALLSLAAAPLSTGCGDSDKDKSSSDAGGDAGQDRFAGCDTIIKAGSTTEQVQEVFIDAQTGQTLCFEDGTYALTAELNLSVADVTVQGNPADRNAVVLDYTGQVEGKDSLTSSGDGFTVQHLSVKNSHGNTIVTRGVKRVTFRDLKVSWDAGSVTSNGAYAVYPLSADGVLVEGCEIVGAADAGIYVGQSKNIIVRNNVVHGNVAGIEIENSDNALVTGNETYDNASGILVFAMPNLEKTTGTNSIVENNNVHDNNHPNFGAAGTTVSYVPPGTGMLVLANDGTEIRKNTFTNNETAAILAVSYQTFATICAANGGTQCGGDDAKTDPYLSKTYIHDNTFTNNGTMPDPLVEGLLGTNLPNVLWDGVTPPDAPTGQFCLGPTPTTIMQFGNNDGFFEANEVITDPNQFTCTIPSPFETITLPQGS
ncbi:MAG: parallel beta-helix domain-containing protein [Myxococcales bacterium]